MTHSCTPDNSILVFPLFFFLPVSTFIELWGGPKGTGMFRLLEKETGIKIGISEKTLRKYLVPPVTKEPSNSVKTKLERWTHHPGQPGFLKQYFSDIESLTASRTGELEWNALIHSFKVGAAGRVYPKTLEYIERLLDEESDYYHKAKRQRQNLREFFKTVYTEPFFTRYGLPVSESLLTEAIEQDPEQLASHLSKQPDLIQSHLHACISLQMDILAHAEVEWFEDNLDQIPKKNHFQSRLLFILPKLEGDEEISPITLFFRMVRNHLGFSSWRAMAEHMEMEGESDIESRLRKLMGWVNVEQHPKHESVFGFLQRLVETKGDYISLYYDNLYLAASFMDGLLELFKSEVDRTKMSASKLLQAFSSYNEHFKRHKTAVIKGG
ncbi:hypothetical protein NX722_24340 [Endozoicomonas gorgoniicola]|uniref:Uncharacterized protein n=1 Tax=Endozoicomonas gorgoniicola TaxID=1234144 RepID=A0ABT3N239_9GAMM|nr:hypothetical protein [Endozoicomonas gorgoniicola]MCW7555700.1 hypothetical protein [Endozoicomonas gorgoniicola]